MPLDFEVVKERFRNLSDDELRKIIYVEYQEYEDDIVDFAKKELKGRYELDIWESHNVTLMDVLLQVDIDRLQEIMLNEHLISPKYTDVINKLLFSEPIKQSDICISIEGKNSNDYKVIGEDLTNGEEVEIHYCSLQEWLGFIIKSEQLQYLGKERFIVYCILAIAELYSDNNIEQDLENIKSVADSKEEPIALQIENEITIDKIAERAKQLKDEAKIREKDYSIRPWVRYWARGIDMSIWGFIIWLIELLFIPYQTIKWFNSLAWGMVASFMIFVSWSFIEAFLLTKWGFTPGKWILYTEVVDMTGNKLTYKDAFRRVWNIFVYGEGFQIPFVSVVTNLISYNRLSNQGITKWDFDGGFKVLHKKIQTYKVLIAIFIMVGVSLLMAYVNQSYLR